MNRDKLRFQLLVGLLVPGLFAVPARASSGAGFELDGITGFQGSPPISLLLGLGAVLEYHLGGFTPMIYGEYDRYDVQYADQKTNYTDYNLGAGFKFYLSSNSSNSSDAGFFKNDFILVSGGYSQLAYNGLTDNSLRVGGGFGIVDGRLEYSISYFQYLGYARDIFLQIRVGALLRKISRVLIIIVIIMVIIWVAICVAPMQRQSGDSSLNPILATVKRALS